MCNEPQLDAYNDINNMAVGCFQVIKLLSYPNSFVSTIILANVPPCWTKVDGNVSSLPSIPKDSTNDCIEENVDKFRMR